jgi:transposase
VENVPPEELRSILARLEALEAENARLRAELARKDQIIAALQQRLFGSSSEKLDPAQLQLLFDEMVLGKPAPPPEPGEDRPAPEEDGKPKPKANRRTKAECFPRNLKILIERVIEPEEVLADPDSWERIGEEHHDELDVIKPEIFWRRTVRPKYRHKANRELPPSVAPAPAPSIPGTLIAPALAAQIITDKYEDHLPHYRQAKRFKRRHGIDLGRQTLNAWTHATLDHLTPIGRAIHNEVLEAEGLQIDETPMDYLDPGHGTTREGRLWVYRDVAGGSCYFDWHAGRGTDCLLEFLGHDAETGTLEWNGSAIHTDGYVAYDVLSRLHGLRHAGCLAHIRRKFTDLGRKSPAVTVPVLLCIQRIYRIEKQMRLSGAPPPCRALIRRARTRPLAEDLIKFIREEIPRHLRGGDVAGALSYASNQWHKFAVCLEDGALELDTNLVENLIRVPKVGMKNYLFFGSFQSGANNALAYTLLANCRLHDLDPEDYLVEVLRRLPSNATLEQAAALTPRAVARERRAAAEADDDQAA